MIALTLLLAAADTPAALLATARTRTSAEHHCSFGDTTDVTVCGLRGADRFRVPLVTHAPGDPRYESVSDERLRLQHRTTPLEELSIFQVGGGMAGVSVTLDREHGSIDGLRPLAP